MIGLVAGAGAAGAAGAEDDGLVAGWLVDGFAAGVGPVVGFADGVPLLGAGAPDVEGAAWAPPLVGRFGIT